MTSRRLALPRQRRRQGRQLPPLSWGRRRFLYGDVCKLGAQLERLLSTVPAEPRVGNCTRRH